MTRRAHLIVFLLIVGCTPEPWPRPPSVPIEQFSTDFQKWRDDRRTRLVAPGSGAVTWVGLWDLNEGTTAAGGDSALPIALPVSSTPRSVGTFERAGAEVWFTPAPKSSAFIPDSTGDKPLNARLAMASDRTESPTVIGVGSLRLRVHGEPGTDRLWIRAWDEDHPARATFQLPESYPPDTAWRVAARFDRYDSPRVFRVPDIAEGTQSYTSPGVLVFHVAPNEYRLVAFAEPKSTSFFVMLWDSTATTTTYEAGRYLRVALPDSTGWTVIDFNRTYNPPCVFTPFSVCAFPPPENRLTFALTAGEKKVR